MRVILEQLCGSFVRLGLNDHVPRHAVLDIRNSLRRRALRLPQRASLIDDGGRIGRPPFHPGLDARSLQRLALFLVQLLPLRLLERGFRADVYGQESLHGFRSSSDSCLAACQRMVRHPSLLIVTSTGMRSELKASVNHALSGRNRLLLMLQDIDQLSEWITDVESAHPPRLGRRAVFDSDTRFSNSHQSLFNIVYF